MNKTSNWILMLALGIIAIILGVLALINPFAASFGVERFVSWAFMIMGVLTIIGAFMGDETNGRIWTIITGVLMLLIGFFLFRNPIAGIVTIAIALGVFMLISGIVRVFVGFKVNNNSLKWLVIISGAASIILAFLVFNNLLWSIGVLLGVELILDGVALAALAFARTRGGVSAI